MAQMPLKLAFKMKEHCIGIITFISVKASLRQVHFVFNLLP